MALLINATVHCVSARGTVFPWQIIAVDPPDSAFRLFFNSQMKAHCDEVNSSRLQLKETFVRGKKDNLDKVCICTIYTVASYVLKALGSR